MNTLESGIDVGQGINIAPEKFDKKQKQAPWINVELLQSNLKIFVDQGKNSKNNKQRATFSRL